MFRNVDASIERNIQRKQEDRKWKNVVYAVCLRYVTCTMWSERVRDELIHEQNKIVSTIVGKNKNVTEYETIVWDGSVIYSMYLSLSEHKQENEINTPKGRSKIGQWK